MKYFVNLFPWEEEDAEAEFDTLFKATEYAVIKQVYSDEVVCIWEGGNGVPSAVVVYGRVYS